ASPSEPAASAGAEIQRPGRAASQPFGISTPVTSMIRVLYVEASSGGVLGGSLTGLYHLIRRIDRERFEPMMVLYEPKPIERDLADLAVPLYHLRRRRLAKEHALQRYAGYHQARRIGLVRSAMHNSREAMRLILEELPAAMALARVVRRSHADVL